MWMGVVVGTVCADRVVVALYHVGGTVPDGLAVEDCGLVVGMFGLVLVRWMICICLGVGVI
jgi:hypothetical protein